MRLILLVAVLVLGVMECESVSLLTRKRGRCGNDAFRRRQNVLKKRSGNEAKKRRLCLRAKHITKHCFKSKKMSEEELFDKWFSECNKKVEGEASSKREENEDSIEVNKKNIEENKKNLEEVKQEVAKVEKRNEKLSKELARRELFDIVERVEECNNKVNRLMDPNYAFVLSEDIYYFRNKNDFDSYKNIYYRYNKVTKEWDLTGPEKMYKENMDKLEEMYKETNDFLSILQPMTGISVDRVDSYRPSREYFKQTFVESALDQYCLERNLALIIGEGNVQKMIRKTNSVHHKCEENTEEHCEDEKVISGEKKCLKEKCNDIFDTTQLEIKSLLHLKFSNEARNAYETIASSINDKRCGSLDFNIDTARLGRSVCILQARGRGQLDQLGYADNFFKLINDQNMVVHKGKGKFQCKLYKSGGEDTSNFCNTREDFIAKEHKLGKKILPEKGGGRRLLAKQHSDKKKEEKEEDAEQNTCNTKFINLKASGNGFGVRKSFKHMSEEPKVQLKVSYPGSFIAVKNVDIHYTKGATTNFLVYLDCKNSENGILEKKLCTCHQHMKLHIFIGKNENKLEDCVFKSGPSWAISRCNTMRRRLLMRSRDRRRRLLQRANAGC